MKNLIKLRINSKKSGIEALITKFKKELEECKS